VADREAILKHVVSFKTKHGVQDQDEHIITTIHMMNTHRLDLAAAQDRTSHGANDKGIDGWHFEQRNGTLFVYQSKLAWNKGTVLKGFEGLVQASDWIATVLKTGELEGKPPNPAIRNLARCLHENRDAVRAIEMYLISPFSPNELEDCSEFAECRHDLGNSSLCEYMTERNGRLEVKLQGYNLRDGGLVPDSWYEVSGQPDGVIQVGKRTKLHIFYLHLSSLVELFRTRGHNLFEKNVRLYLDTKESRNLLEHPLQNTLDRICDIEREDKLDSAIFPFYHVGITLTAYEYRSPMAGIHQLQSPYVINGCQTINIADRYLRELEKKKSTDKIARFRTIAVLTKIVVAANDAQVREIANCNNRQNPIDSWQLFSNDPIHIAIENAFENEGVFYERQKGKFDAFMKNAAAIARYYNTNGTKITVQDLGQLISLCRRRFKLAAKLSDIFIDKNSHDEVFDEGVPNQVHDAVWAFNAFKAAKNGLRNFLRCPAHDNEQTHSIFVKPAVRQRLFYLAVMHLYQRRGDLATRFGYRLNKHAPPKLTTEAEGFYKKVVLKTKAWYLVESKQLQEDVSSDKLDGFLGHLCHEAGLDSEGLMPFTERSRDWSGSGEADDAEADCE
jgi:hypothetical protein